MTKLTKVTTKYSVKKIDKNLNNPLGYYHNKMEMNWDYVAGFFDGEGCVTLYKEKTNKWGKAVKVSITQKDTESLKEIKKFLHNQGLERVGFYTWKKRDCSCIQI